jgi:serpin B
MPAVGVTMPRWETDATLDLTPALAALGLGSLTDPRGDLDGVFADAFVSGVAQGATITVAERGTVAAAVTQVEVGITSAPLEPVIQLVLDRPFEYQVIEVGTGLVLFAGRVADPSA